MSSRFAISSLGPDVQKEDVDVVNSADTLNFEGDVLVTDEGDGKATITIGETGQFKGKMIDFTFVSNGNSADKWMGFAGRGAATSDDLPMVMIQDCAFAGITWMNIKDNMDADIELYKNGQTASDKVFTWQVRNKRWAWNTDVNGMVTFAQGDRLSVFLRKIGNSVPNDPQIEVFFALTSDYETEGGAASGI